MCVTAFMMVVGFITMGLGMLLIVPLYFVLCILILVWEIQACIAASGGQWYRYPVCIRFIA